MNIRVRRHNDNPQWIVAEWIVDGKVKDDNVDIGTTTGIARAVGDLVRDNAETIGNHIFVEEGLDDL